jgi:hypothetical protein
MTLARVTRLVIAALLAVSASLPTQAAEGKPLPTDTGDGWTDRENAIWNELAERYGVADVSIARHMFPRASVDIYVYRDAVSWLQDQQNTRLDRDKGTSYTNTYRER